MGHTSTEWFGQMMEYSKIRKETWEKYSYEMKDYGKKEVTGDF
jgi:hypothetical protein